jgi:threonine-phosphate decarboxylase
MIHGHGGNIHAWARRLGCRPEEMIDVSSNINPLGPPPGLMAHLREHLGVICRLPEVDSREVNTQMAAWLGVDEGCVLAGAGTTQFIHAIFAALASRRVLIVGPTYADYADACRGQGIAPQYLLAQARDDFRIDAERLARQATQADTVVICNPNNPTGGLIPGQALHALCRRYPATRFVIDESYLPFVLDGEDQSMVTCGLENVIVLHSLSKIYRLAGLRIGFVIAAPPVIATLRRCLAPWSLNSLAQAAVAFLCEQRASIERFARHTRDFIARERRRIFARLQAERAGTPHPSTVNFFLVQLPAPHTAGQVRARLAQERILIRDCSNFYGLDDRYIRIALHQPEVNDRVAEMLLSCASSDPGTRMDGTHG